MPLVLACLLVLAPHCGAEPLPRIAVAGALRLGYGGTLLRAGIPFDYLTDHEQCDLGVLRRYDLLLCACGWMQDADDWTRDSLRALDTYVREGGRLVCELNSLPPDAFRGLKRSTEWISPQDKRKAAVDFRLEPGDSPFLALLPHRRAWRYKGPAAKLAVTDPGVTILARFRHEPLEGKPAILYRRYGQGEILYFAGMISYVQSNWRPDYEDLILAAVRFLTHGRAQPQWSLAEGAATPDLPPDENAPADNAAPPPGTEDLGAAPAAGYCVKVAPPAGGSIRLQLDDLAITLTGQRAVVSATGRGDRQVARAGSDPHPQHTGSQTRTGDLPVAPTGASRATFRLPDKTAEVILQRLPGRLAVAVDGVVLGQLDAPLRPGAGIFAPAAAKALLQPLEPLYFTDDFARAGKVAAPWSPRAGSWLLTGTGAPYVRAPEFALRGRHGSLTAGEWFWSDVRLQVAVRPLTCREVRLVVARWDDRDGLELRCAVGSGRASLVRVRHGREQRLGTAAARLVAGQWSRLSLAVRDGKALAGVDDETILRADTPDVSLGSIALAAYGGEAVFDDVRVTDSSLTPPQPLVHPADYDKGSDGLLDHDTWSHPAAAWVPLDTPGTFVHKGLFGADFELLVPFRPSGPAPRLTLLAGTDRARLAPLAAATGQAGKVALRRRAGVLSAAVDGRPVPLLSSPRGPLCLGLSFAGVRLAPADIRLTAEDVHEYVFDRVTSDWWEADGEWEVGARWPCSPQWAWLRGNGTPRAVLWHKHKALGDLVVEGLLGARMREMQQFGEVQNEPMERLRIGLCGNGREPWHGYVFELGSESEGLSRLYRNHKVVATAVQRLPYPRETHNLWGDLWIERRGAALTCTFQGRPFLSYTDPDPLPDGLVSLWTENNNVMTPYLAVYAQLDETVVPPRLPSWGEWLANQLRPRRFGMDIEPITLSLAGLFGWE
ncbi:MAG: hypothetical protein HYU66_00575 [Armatimonadetes bacterium]|nr:hypothetical protein [Armatimonadota bacterium]